MSRSPVHTKYIEGIAHLRDVDPVLDRIIDHVGRCELRSSNSHFLTLMEAIVWQQLSWKAACTIHERLLAVVGRSRPTPQDILTTPVDALRSAGLSRRKCDYVHELASIFNRGEISTRRLRSMRDEDVITELTSIRGIGRWTAEMFLIFGFNRLDVFPLGDLGLRKSIDRYYNGGHPLSMDEVTAITDRWRPYRTIGSWYVWATGDSLPLQGHP